MSRPSLPPALLRLGVRQVGRKVLDPDLPWAVQRRRLDKILAASPVARGSAVTRQVLNGVRADVMNARGARPQRAVVHFHGGGYCVGSARMARTWAAQLSAKVSCQVVMPEYRLAPEHPHPAALDDARAIISALLTDFAPGSIVVSGDSAGGGLALSLVLAMLAAGQEPPAGCILLSPWLDLGQDRRAYPGLVRKDVMLSPGWLTACATAYASPSSWADPLVSPLNAAPDGLPPLLIQAGSEELLVHDAERLAARAATAGVDVTYTKWPRMWHDFALQAGMLAASDSALSQAAWFVDRVTSS